MRHSQVVTRVACYKFLLALSVLSAPLYQSRAAPPPVFPARTSSPSTQEPATETSNESVDLRVTIRDLEYRINYSFSRSDFLNELSARRELVSVLRKKYGSSHLKTREAEGYLQSVKRICDFEPDNQKRIAKARAFCLQAESHHRAGNSMQALTACKEAFRIYKDVMGETDFVTLTILKRLSKIQNSLEMHEEAKSSLSKALQIRLKLMGDKDSEAANLMNNLGIKHLLLKENEQAEKLFIRSIGIYVKRKETDSLHYGIVNYNLARVCNAAGKFKKAEMAARNAFQITGMMLPDQYPYYVGSQIELARSYGGQEKYSEAVNVHKRLISILETFRKNPPPASLRIQIYEGYAKYSRQIKNDETAEEFMKKADLLRSRYGIKDQSLN